MPNLPPRPKRPIFPPANHYSMARPLPPAPKKKGQFPKELFENCKKCRKIYCSGWTIAVYTYFTIWRCEQYSVQKKNKWEFII